MKKIISVLLFGILSSAIIVSNVSAQFFPSGFTNASLKKEDASAATGKAEYKAAKASAKAYKANLRATTNFSKEYKDAPQPTWYTEKKAIVAHFTNNDIQTRVIYDRKGHWLHTMSTYHQDKLSPDVRKLVRRNFPGYDITLVQDIKEGLEQFYVIHLEDKTTYKQVSVYNGETGVIAEHDKSM